MQKVYELTKQLGVKITNERATYLALATCLVIQDPSYMRHMGKRLYSDIAALLGKTPLSVSRGISRAVCECWDYGNHRFLNQVAGCRVLEKPSPAEMISFMADYLVKQEPKHIFRYHHLLNSSWQEAALTDIEEVMASAPNKRRQTYTVCIEQLVPENHPVRLMDDAVNWEHITKLFTETPGYSTINSAVSPIQFIRFLLLISIYKTKSPQCLIEALDINIAYRWFLELGLADEAPTIAELTDCYNLYFADNQFLEKLLYGILETYRKKRIIKIADPATEAKKLIKMAEKL
ncbi:hypothetical protein LQE92_06470 [Lacrimispora sp. NSJ-141]|uniref:Transposase n=2 Tax=Lientehia hominis TaxID=2897778 RepID=A0AAP2RIY3_9FIRM|nr:sporulation initiation factor Spo0A C-terminal domain-containing protein [Lientehia hominis]MCD2492274.1 hypothetical protein [Lientehia hominis]